MAKRSDFAQKLLDDLRLRKERMATSQNSNQSTAVSIDAYAYAKQMHRGNRDIKAHNTGSNKAIKSSDRLGSGSRRFLAAEASQQIVPYGKGQKSQQIDLSTALTFALENGGSFKKTDSVGQTSVLSLLNQIVGRRMDFKLGRRNSLDLYNSSNKTFPILSQQQIKEISKGAIKLNQILRACSNGLNFDHYSVELGRELLKGALNLEESLRMLVTFQDDSEYMTTPARKSRITLLEEDEEDDEDVKISGQKQLDLPCFSFDRTSRTAHTIQEIAKTDIKQRLMAQNDQKETAKYYTLSNKQSSTCSPDIKTPAPLSVNNKDLSSSQSKPDKGRIPNVVAKLMGLELPENAESKHMTHENSTGRKMMEGKIGTKTAQVRTKDLELKARATKKMATHTGKPRLTGADKVPGDQETALSLPADKNIGAHSVIYDMVMNNGRTYRKDIGVAKAQEYPRKASVMVDQRQSNDNSSNQDIGSKKYIEEKERKQNLAKHQEPRGTERVATKERFLRDELQQVTRQKHKRSGSADIQQEERYKGRMLQMEKRSADNLLLNNQTKHRNDQGFPQSYMSFKSETEEQHQVEEKVQQNARQKPPLRKQRGSELASKMQKQRQIANEATPSKDNAKGTVNLVQSERYTPSRQRRDLFTDKSAGNLNIGLNNSLNRGPNQKLSSEDPRPKLEKEKPEFLPDVEEKSIYLPAIQKTKHTNVQARKIPRNVDEVMTKRNASAGNYAKPLKHQSSLPQEVKQKIQKKDRSSSEAGLGKTNKSRDAGMFIIKSNNMPAGIQTLKVGHLQKELQEVPTSIQPAEENCQITTDYLTPNKTSQASILTASNNCQNRAPTFDKDENLEPSKTTSNLCDGMYGNKDFSFSSQLQDQKIFISRTHEPLTESEKNIKQILMKSQLFLNTAEALFKLNIPVGILNANGQDCQNEDGKIILDCGYEVMRRQGKIQELNLHPCMKISIFSTPIKSLDDLVKHIHKDFEKLKHYGTSRSFECDVEDYLPGMLDADLRNGDPDINCMWDLGWNETMFTPIEKDEVVREVEKYMLNGLIDEALRDVLLHLK